tara:strand:+ start:3521 stop:3952 length:432 start_codon:yes stop_codon:yes gene_type:complete
MVNKVFDALDKTFQVTQTKTDEPKTPAIITDSEDSVEGDFEEARQALKRSMSYNEEAIQGILGIAQNSDNPRAFEVAGQLIKSMAEGAKDIMEVQEKKQKIDKVNGNIDASNVTNNNLFVGSTSDLLKMINKQQEKTVENDAD